MKVWVDADGCPRRIRDIIVKAANREKVQTTLVADREIPLESGESVAFVRITPGEDSVDDYICQVSSEGDLAITRDVLLAKRLVDKGVLVLDDRGGIYTKENINERVSLRDFMMELRTTGGAETKRKSFRLKEVQLFANAFDKTLKARLNAARH